MPLISAFKRFVHTNNGQTSGPDKVNDDKKRLYSGVQPMDSSLQKKFSKGVQYNMKIIIRGDKNVGKTSLFLRLQGEQFKEDYIPTDEIQVANIDWYYNVTDDTVKVEIWDIQDKGKKRKPVNELKLNDKKGSKSSTIQQLEQETDEIALDAEFIDVYKNTNGCILMFDLTKIWTFEYIEREIHNIPKNIPIVILGNHRDQGHHGLPINEDKVKFFIESIEKDGSARIRYIETSMRNGFGLKFLYKWFNLPFLEMKKQTLIKQLQVNDREIDACCQELILLEESDDQNYERFLYTIQNRRREIADKLSQVLKPTNFKSDTNLVSKSMPFNLVSSSSINGNLALNQIIKPSPSIIIGANNPLPIPKSYPTASKSSPLKEDKKLIIENETDDQAKLRHFLEDAIEVQETLNSRQTIIEEESENEEELKQPKILSYQEDLDVEDRIEGCQPSSILEEKAIVNSKTSPSKNELTNHDLNNDQVNESEIKISRKDSENNGHKEILKKENKIVINLVDNLPIKTILEKEKSHPSTKLKKSKKAKKSSKDHTSTKKKSQLEDLLGPDAYISAIQDYSNDDQEYIAL